MTGTERAAGRLKGKVAFVTGAGRGQGRSHAVRMASEGADIVGVDICQDISTIPYPLSSTDDLAETARLVEAAGGSILTRVADVRDLGALQAAVDEGVAQFGHIDVLCANAGIGGAKPIVDLTEDDWDTMIAVNLSGVWRTLKAALPAMISSGRGGSVIITSSVAGLKGLRNTGHYVAAKHGLIGLAKTLANEVANHNIRVNVLCPSSVNTPMMINDWTFNLFRPDLEEPTLEDAIERYKTIHLFDIPWVEAVDVSNAAVWLASDEARYLTGAVLPIDGGAAIRH